MTNTVAGRVPRFKLPRGTCDTHCHIFGPRAVFPFLREGGGDDFDAPKEALAAQHRRLGVSRAVIVQGNSHGIDNSVVLDSIAAAGGSQRGVALVAPEITDAELADLHAGGIRGVRYTFVPRLGGGPPAAVVQKMAARIKDLGWHIVLIFAAGTLPDYVGMMRSLNVPVVIDHMGWPVAEAGLEQPTIRRLLELLGEGRTWVKLSGASRVSTTGSPYNDAIPYAVKLVEAAPDRVIWGSDWPHPNPGPSGPPDDAELVDLIPTFAPDAAQRQKLLVDNPAALYGFPV